MPNYKPWPPTTFVDFIRGFDTSVGTAEILTDAGPAFIKALGNRGGPHHLASEWVGSNLARWFGLPTFDFAILHLREGDYLPYVRGGQAVPGPAFVTRSEKGATWKGDPKTLKKLTNPRQVAWLVVFDTWVLNWDRHPPDESRRPNYDNVFLSQEGVPRRRYLLKAMDHTHCFGCRAGELTKRIDRLDPIRDDRVFGLFPDFKRYVHPEAIEAACRRLGTVTRAVVEPIVAAIPREWEVDAEIRQKLIEQVVQRASYLTERLGEQLRSLL